MIDPQDSIFHYIYSFEEWMYSESMEEWLRLAREEQKRDEKDLICTLEEWKRLDNL